MRANVQPKGLSRTSNGFVWGPVISRTGSSLAFSTYVHTPTYAGLLERNDEYLPGLHEAIVSHENFDQVMALRQTKVGPDQFAKMAVGNSEFFLTGVVRCGVCGGAVVGTAANSKGRHYRYYDCSMKTKRADAERCCSDRVDADALESTVVSQLIDAYRDSDLFPAAVRLAVRQSPGHLAELDEQVAATSAAVAHSMSALDRYYAALESGKLLASDVRGRLESLERQLEAQRHELARLQHEREASLGRRARRVGRGEFRTPRSGDVAGSDGR